MVTKNAIENLSWWNVNSIRSTLSMEKKATMAATRLQSRFCQNATRTRLSMMLLLAIFCNLFVKTQTTFAFAPLIAAVTRTPRSTTTALQVAIDTSDIKNGLTVELDGEPHKVCMLLPLGAFFLSSETAQLVRFLHFFLYLLPYRFWVFPS
jgi:hypothetical protein